MELVEGDAYLLAVTRYIHLNPVKIAACRRMNGQQRLDRLKAYPWSSYGGYAAAGKAQEFVTYDVLKEYGRDQAMARRHYRAYVAACLLEDDGPLLEAMAASRYAIGSAAFAEKTDVRIEERRSGRVQDRDLDLPRWTVPLEEIDAAVAALRPRFGRLEGARAACRPGQGGGRGVGFAPGGGQWPRCRRALWNWFLRDRGHSPPARRQARGIGCRRIVGATTAEKENKVQSVSLTPTSDPDIGDIGH